MLRLEGLGNKLNKIVPRHWNSGAQSNCSVFMTSNYIWSNYVCKMNHSHKSLHLNHGSWWCHFSCIRKTWFLHCASKLAQVNQDLEGNDVFVSLPTGSGKSLCYVVLPYAFDEFRGRDGSIAIIVAPLKAFDEKSGIIMRSGGRNSSNTNRCRSLH